MHSQDFCLWVDAQAFIINNFGQAYTGWLPQYFALHSQVAIQEAIRLCFVQKKVQKIEVQNTQNLFAKLICSPMPEAVMVTLCWQNPKEMPLEDEFKDHLLSNLNCVLICNPFFVVQYVNPAMLKTSRWQPDYFLDKNLETIFAGQSPIFEQEIYSLLSDYGSWQGELYFFNKYAHKIWLKVHIQKHKHQIILIGTDITTNKLHEQLMVESEKRFSNIYEKMPIMLFTTNPNLEIEDISLFCQEVLGMERSQIIGNSVAQFLFTKQKNPINNLIILQNEHEILVKTKMGVFVEVWLNTHLDYDQDGQLSSIFIVLQDISELNQTKRQLSAQKYALDQAAIVTITDKTGRIQYANEKFCQISGYTMDELLGNTHALVNSGLHSKAFFAQMWQSIVKGNIWRGEIRNRKKNGEYYWVDATIVPFLNEKKQVEQFLAIRFEITDRKILQEKIEEYNAELENKVVQRTREIKDANELLLNQNHLLNQKNKYITDSIQYAKRIQEAILPTPREINQVFREAFVFFQPKDIVSGDFYWFEHIENCLIVAAADCTGHGVPGALMSMIGSTLLDKIVSEENSTSPSKILTLLNSELLKLLKSPQSRDGMDIALCTYNTQMQELRFAGANNPLVLIQNNQIQVVRGDKTGIGNRKQSHYIFSEYALKIQEETMAYIFTDGYADQFGGKEKRKMMSRNFREFLLQIHQQNPQDQQKLLAQNLQDWISEGKEKQLDDVLVIGFRLRKNQNQQDRDIQVGLRISKV